MRGRETRDQAAASPSRSMEASFGPLTNDLGGGCCAVSSGCKRRTQSWAMSSVTAGCAHRASTSQELVGMGTGWTEGHKMRHCPSGSVARGRPAVGSGNGPGVRRQAICSGRW